MTGALRRRPAPVRLLAGLTPLAATTTVPVALLATWRRAVPRPDQEPA